MLRQIQSVRKVDSPDPIAAAVAECNRQWHERIHRYAAALLRSWEAFEQAVTVLQEDLDGEVTEDEWGDLSASFKHLQRIGVRFDPLFIERFDALNPVPFAFGPKDQCKGTRTGNARAITSESFVEDDEYEHGGDGAKDDNEDDDPAGGEEWH